MEGCNAFRFLFFFFPGIGMGGSTLFSPYFISFILTTMMTWGRQARYGSVVQWFRGGGGLGSSSGGLYDEHPSFLNLPLGPSLRPKTDIFGMISVIACASAPGSSDGNLESPELGIALCSVLSLAQNN